MPAVALLAVPKFGAVALVAIRTVSHQRRIRLGGQLDESMRLVAGVPVDGKATVVVVADRNKKRK